MKRPSQRTLLTSMNFRKGKDKDMQRGTLLSNYRKFFMDFLFIVNPLA